MIKASIKRRMKRPIFCPTVLWFSRDGVVLLGFNTSPQFGHAAAFEETCFPQVGQFVSVAILFLLIDVG
jgi:hypothetical protein